jgi:hypothetical protein
VTREEAQQIAAIASTVDGGCSCCIKSVVAQLNHAFPEWEWFYPDDWDAQEKDGVTVKERVSTCLDR